MLKSIHFVEFFNDNYFGKRQYNINHKVKTNRRERQSRKRFNSAKNKKTIKTKKTRAGGQKRSNASTRMPSRAFAAKHSFSFLPSEEPGCGKGGKNEKIRSVT